MEENCTASDRIIMGVVVDKLSTKRFKETQTSLVLANAAIPHEVRRIREGGVRVKLLGASRDLLAVPEKLKPLGACTRHKFVLLRNENMRPAVKLHSPPTQNACRERINVGKDRHVTRGIPLPLIAFTKKHFGRSDDTHQRSRESGILLKTADNFHHTRESNVVGILEHKLLDGHREIIEALGNHCGLARHAVQVNVEAGLNHLADVNSGDRTSFSDLLLQNLRPSKASANRLQLVIEMAGKCPTLERRNSVEPTLEGIHSPLCAISALLR